MNWDAFHFSCRFLSTTLSINTDPQKALDLLNSNYGSVYAKAFKSTPVYKEIQSSSDVDRIKDITALYGKLKFDWDESIAATLVGFRNYLFLLASFFLILSGIIQLYVIPVLRETFAVAGYSTTHTHLHTFSKLWFFSLFLLFIIGIAVIRLSTVVKHVGNVFSNSKLSSTSKLLLSKKIVNQILELEALVYAPLKTKVNAKSDNAIQFVAQLEADNMHITYEIQQRFDSLKKSIVHSTKRRIKIVLSIFAVCLVLAIFNFVTAIYAPIFTLGQLI